MTVYVVTVYNLESDIIGVATSIEKAKEIAFEYIRKNLLCDEMIEHKFDEFGNMEIAYFDIYSHIESTLNIYCNEFKLDEACI